MECGRLIPRAQVPSAGHTMGPLWFCSGCGIRWEISSCLLEQLHNGLHSWADKSFHKNAFFPSHIAFEQDALWEVTGGDMSLHQPPWQLTQARPATRTLSPSAGRPGVVSTGSRGTWTLR